MVVSAHLSMTQFVKTIKAAIVATTFAPVLGSTLLK